MRVLRKVAAGLAVFTMVAGAVSTPAMAGDFSSAEKLRKLDIMLMVSALRCRFSADGFQADYYDFSRMHLQSLNAANRELEAGFRQQFGATGAKRALDRMSVSMANHYGQGHPTMGCADLKAATQELAHTGDRATLLAAADRLLAESGDGRVTLAARN